MLSVTRVRYQDADPMSVEGGANERRSHAELRATPWPGPGEVTPDFTRCSGTMGKQPPPAWLPSRVRGSRPTAGLIRRWSPPSVKRR